MASTSKYTLRYADTPSTTLDGDGYAPALVSYSLVELPAALNSPEVLSSLVIKGQPHDDAVLCTPSETWSIRAVQNSNSLLLCAASFASSASVAEDKGKTRRDAAGETLDIQATLHQTLELERCVPKLERISELLRGQEWALEEELEEEDLFVDGPPKKRRKTKRYSRKDALNLVPASDAQITAGLNQRRIISLDGNLRPLRAGTLSLLLKNILSTLTLLSHDSRKLFPLTELSESLQTDDNVPKEVTEQVVRWFGSESESEPGKWRLDIRELTREIGRELLAGHRNKSVPLDKFVAEWKEAVGEHFASECSVDQLAGHYLLTPSKRASAVSTSDILYFPVSALPADPSARFNELFAVRPKWAAAEMAPFLLDLAAEAKKRDALTLKFTRKIKGDDGAVYFTARGR